MKRFEELKLSDLTVIHPDLRIAADQLGFRYKSDGQLAKQLGLTEVNAQGEYLSSGTPTGLHKYYKTKPRTSSPPSTGEGGTISQDIQDRLSALETGLSKRATIDALAAISSSLSANSAQDAELKARIDALLSGAEDLKLSDLRAQITSLSQSLQQNTNVDTQQTRRLTALEQATARLPQSRTKDINTGTFDANDLGHLGTALINTPDNAAELLSITGGWTGQIIFVRCTVKMSIKHDSSKIRCKNNTDITGVNGNTILQFFCLSGGGVTGGGNVWLQF